MAEAIEKFDVVDEGGTLTGEVLPKEVVHKHGLWHEGVHLWITDGESVLMAMRDPNKALMPGRKDVIAGHKKAGEYPDEAAVREAREEIGLPVELDELEFFGRTITNMAVDRWGGQRHRAFDYNYVVRVDEPSLAEIVPEEGSISNPEWVGLEKLAADLRNPQARNEYAMREPMGLELYALGIMAMRGQNPLV